MQYLGPRGIRNRSMGYARCHRKFGINPFELKFVMLSTERLAAKG